MGNFTFLKTIATFFAANRLRAGLAFLVGAFTMLNLSSYAAPMSGTYTVPGSFATIAAAVTSLNTNGVNGAVIINATGGGSETAPSGGIQLGSATLNATTSSSNTITFQTSGGGGNYLIKAQVGTAAFDFIFGILGTDWVTINGINLAESATNTTAVKEMEFGYALLNLSAADGCQNDEIENCTITLNHNNTNFPTGILGDHASAAGTAYTVTTTPGAANTIKIYGNTVTNAVVGIEFLGFAAASPYTLYDQNIDIGGSSAATGNLIEDLVTATGANDVINGIILEYANNSNTSYNTINPAANGGATATVYEQGIILYGINSTFTANNNNITLANTQALNFGAGIIIPGIYTFNVAGLNLTANNNTMSISESGTTKAEISGIYHFGLGSLTATGNTLALSSAVAGTPVGIFSDGAAGTINVSTNTITMTTPASNTTTSVYDIEVVGTATTETVSGNTFAAGSTILNSSGTMYLIYSSNATPSTTISNNLTSGTITHSATLGNTYGIYVAGAPASGTWAISGNNLSNMATTGSPADEGNLSAAIATSITSAITCNISGNTISGLSGSATAATFGVGIYTSNTATTNITGNTMDSWSSAETGGFVDWEGYTITGSGAVTMGGSAANANSFTNITAGGVGTGGNGVYGVDWAGSGAFNCSYNTFSNLVCNGTVPVYFYGFDCAIDMAGTGPVSVTNNTISTLTCPNEGLCDISSATNGTSTVMGIYYNQTTAAPTIANNTISALSATAGTGAWYPAVIGIGTDAASTAGNMYGNLIYGLTNTAVNTSTYPGIAGIRVYSGAWQVYNNQILLTNGANTNGVRLYGMEDLTANTNSYYFNSIYISGSATATSSVTTAAFNNSLGSKANLNFENNILYNIRTSTSPATGVNYDIALTTAPTAITSNNNEFWTGSVAGTATNMVGIKAVTQAQTFTTWKTEYSSDGNSQNGKLLFNQSNPPTTDLTPLATTDCYLSGKGLAITTGNYPPTGPGSPGIKTDYTGVANNRNNPPAIGAIEFIMNANTLASLTDNTNSTGPAASLTVCNSDNITTGATSSGPATLSYAWTTPDAASEGNVASFSRTVTAAMGGTYTVTVTDQIACTSTASANLTISPLPISNPGSAVTSCQTPGTTPFTFNASATEGGTAGSVLWSYAAGVGTGSITANANSLTGATFTPTTGTGSGTLTLTVNGSGVCAGHSATNTTPISWGTTPTVNPGSAISQCVANVGSSITVNPGANVTGDFSGVTWTYATTGGSLSNINSLNGASFTTSNAVGSGTLTLTATGSGGCVGTNPANNVAINWSTTPVAVAGNPITSCSNVGGGIAITSGASATNGAGVLWSTPDGTGSFGNATSISSAFYTPSAGDISAGSITLMLTVTGIAPCGNATDTKTLTITPAPVINAGSNVSTCAGAGAVNITTGASASNYGTLTWSTPDGTGSFSNANSLTLATYSPSAGDISAGHVTIMLTGTGNGTCGNGTDTKTLTINPLPTATVSGSTSICSGSSTPVNVALTGSQPWSITTFDGTNSNNVTGITSSPYIFSVSPSGNTTYTVTAVSDANCTGNSSGSAVITILPSPNPPVSGGDQSACFGSSIPNLTVTVGGGQTANWYNVATGGVALASGTTTFATGQTAVGVYTYYAEAQNTSTLCVSSTRTPVTLTISGGPAAPSIQDNSLAFTAIVAGSMTISWSNGDGNGHLVKMNQFNSFTNPVNNTSYTANPAWLNAGEQVVYNNTGNSVTVTGLNPNVVYWVEIYGYNSSACGITYNTSTAADNPIPDAFVWTGTISTVWGTSTNWSAGVVPPNSCSANVYIPAGTPFSPTLGTAQQVGAMSVASGAIVTLNANLSVCQGWTGGQTTAGNVIGTGVTILNGSGTSQKILGNTVFNELRLDNAAGALMQAGSKVNLVTSLDLQAGNFNSTSGTLTFTSSSVTQIAILDNFSTGYTGTFTGNITAQRYYGYTYNSQHMLGSPINNPTMAQMGASGTSGYIIPLPNCDEQVSAANSPWGTVFSYHESNGSTCGQAQWFVETAGNANNAQGYSVVLAPANRIFALTGAPNLSASYSQTTGNSNWNNTTLQNRHESSGWMLMSNPYLATLNLTTANAGFDSQVQVWEANGPFAGTYQAFSVNSNAVIAPFQAFMVHKTSVGGSATYNINATDRTRSVPSTFYNLNSSELNISVQNIVNGLLDQTTVAFNSSATDQFDPAFDANKFGGSLNRHTLYTELATGQWMSTNVLNSINTTSTVDMGFEAGATGTYAMTFAGINSFDATSYITLEDRKAGTMTDVRNGNGTYTFTADSSDDWNRFVLHFTPPAVIGTGNASCMNAGSINITQPGTANWSYTITDNNNATISSGVLNQTNPVTVAAQAGNYTLTLVDNNNYTVTKTIVVGGAPDLTAGFTMPANVSAGSTVNFSSTSQNAATYVWTFSDGTIINGVANTSYAFTTPGTYTVTLTVTSADGCVASVSQTITVSGATAIANTEANKGINLWSSDNKVYVDFRGVSSVDATIKIYNILGQELSTDKYNVQSVYQKEINDIDAAYVMVSVNNAGQITTRKLFIGNTK